MARNDGRTRAANVFGKPGKSYPKGSLAHPAVVEERTDQQEAGPKTFLTANADVPGALLVAQNSEKGDNTDAVYNESYMTLPGPSITKSAKFDEYGNLIITVEQDNVASTASGISDTTSQSQEYDGVDAVRGRIITEEYPNSFAQITEIEKADASIPGSRATVYRYLVTAASSIPADDSVTTYTRKIYPPNYQLRIEEKTVYAIPSNFSEMEDQGHHFPELFISAVGTDAIGIYYNFRPRLTGVWPCRIDHTFDTTMATASALEPTPVIEAEWRYPLGFTGRSLTNAESLNFARGGATISLNLPASTPSTATWITWSTTPASHQLLIGGTSRIWRAGIYHTTKIYTNPR